MLQDNKAPGCDGISPTSKIRRGSSFWLRGWLSLCPVVHDIDIRKEAHWQMMFADDVVLCAGEKDVMELKREP